MPETYILYSEKLDKYYIGSCTDIRRRLFEHNIGHSAFTSRGTPWKLVYSENYETLPQARRRELEIKKRKSRKFIESLLSKK